MGQVLEATSERPFLCLRMDLDLEEIARLLLELGDRGAAPVAADRGLFVARMDESLLDAVLRMVKLLDTPEDIAVLAPAVRREIYYRVLRGELGQRLVDLAECDGGNHRIVRALAERNDGTRQFNAPSPYADARPCGEVRVKLERV
jgi:hypothetical protein